MSEQDHRVVEQLVASYFSGRLDAERVEEMRQHLRDCDVCRAHYDRLALAEQRVVGQGEARMLADQRVLDAIVRADQAPPRPAAVRRWWLAFALAPAAAVAAAFVFAILIRPIDGGDRLVARGPGAVSAAVGLGVAAVDPAHDQVYDARRPEGVALAHRLRFSYSNSAGSARYLFLFGVDDGLNPYWYFPLPEEKTSLPVEHGPKAVQLPLPYETELAKRHHAGRLRAVALFSTMPIELTAVDAALAAARADQRSLDQIVWPDQPSVHIVELLLVAGVGQ